MGDALVDREFEHLGIHQNHPDMLWAAFIEQADQHAVDPYGFTRAGGACNQQVGHLAEVSDHGRAGNIMTKGECQIGFGLVEGLRGQHFPEVNRLSVGIRYLYANHALPRYDFHHSHGNHRQGACEVLGQIRDTGNLDPCRGLDFKTCYHGPGIDRGHLSGHAKVL